MSTPPGFGRLLRELRGSMRQEELARELHVSRSLVANVETGRNRPSENFFVRVIDIFPEHERALSDAFNAIPPPKKGSPYKFTDADRFAQGRFNTMIRVGQTLAAQKGMEFALGNGPQPIQRLWLLKRLGEVALARGEVPTALDRYREGISAAIEEGLPGWEESHRIALANYCIHQDRIPEAHEVLDEGLARNAEEAVLWRAKGVAFKHEHNYPAAYACMMTAEGFGLRKGDVDWDRGCVLAEWGHYSAAIADLTHALNRQMSARDHANARFVRAYCYGQLGDLELALKEFAAAEEVVSDSAFLYWFRAHVYLSHGQIDRALADLRHALTLPTGLNTLKQQRAEELITELDVAGASREESASR